MKKPFSIRSSSVMGHNIVHMIHGVCVPWPVPRDVLQTSQTPEPGRPEAHAIRIRIDLWCMPDANSPSAATLLTTHSPPCEPLSPPTFQTKQQAALARAVPRSLS